MGNMENNPSSFSLHSRSYDWKPISTTDTYEIVMDTHTHTQGQRYVLHPRHPEREIDVFEFRNKNREFIPEVLSIQPLYSNDICAQSVSLNVVMERIPFRLVDLGHLGFAEGLYILDRVLRGGQQIFRNMGSIHHDDTMICFSEAGKPKIWINENLSKNQSEISVRLTEKEIVLEIMTILETRMGGNKFRTYMDEKRQTHIQNFKTAIEFIQKMKEKDGTLISSIILPSTQLDPDGKQPHSTITSEGHNFKSIIKYQTPQKQIKSLKSPKNVAKHQKTVTSLMKPPASIKKSLSPYRLIPHQGLIPKTREVLTQANRVNRVEKVPSKINMRLPLKSPSVRSPHLGSMKESRLDEEVKKVTRRQLLADEYRLYSYG